VSAHIKSLEEELGLSLFIRTPKGMALTREGNALREKAKAALSTIADLHREASIMKEKVVGTARIGFHIDPRYLKLDLFMSHMRQHYPELDFHLLQYWSYQQPEAFKKNLLDGAYAYDDPGLPELEAVTLKQVNVVVVGPAQWKEQIDGADWTEIAQLPWIWTPPNCNFNRIASQAFHSRNLSPNKVSTADQEPMINTLVSSGLGMALMIEDEAQDAVAEGRITIWDQKIDSINLSFVYPRNRSSDPMVKAVVEAICKVWEVCDRIAK
jgi:DNA-binding transcriptional LysR family regulator